MQHNSVSYTIGFAAVICVVCSLLVSSSATFLKERQDANEALDRQKKIYAVSNNIYNLKDVVVEDVTAFFETQVEEKTLTIASELGADTPDWEVFEVYDKDGPEGGRSSTCARPDCWPCSTSRPWGWSPARNPTSAWGSWKICATAT